MAHPTLHLAVDGAWIFALEPPPLGDWPRDWILAVASVQASVTDGAVRARLRAHATGGSERVWPLGQRATVHAVLRDGAALPPLPPLTPPPLGDAAAMLVLSVDGVEMARARMVSDGEQERSSDGKRERERERPRAFGHVFCRWLRDGASEPGCDLTDFLVLPPGVKFERLASRPLAVGELVGLSFASRDPS